MSTTATNASPTSFQTKVSGYDRVSAMMAAMVFMLGFFATILFLIWLTKIVVFKPRMPKVIAIQDLKGGAAAEGVARDPEEPGTDELPDVQEPQIMDALEAVTDAISTTKGVTNAVEGNASEMGTGSGLGDSRAAGPGGDGDLDVIPPWERWEIRFSTASTDDYAKQLDFFEIELGALHRTTPNIEYARNLSAARPPRSKGTRGNEPRLYFIHPKSGPLVSLTTALLNKAGVATDKRYLAQFYSNDAFNRLLAVEKASLGNRSLATVRKTIFGVQPAGSGYQFHVIRHEFL